MALAALAALLFLRSATIQAQIHVERVSVGNLGNMDHGGIGAVDYHYSIGRFPITAGQYTAMLNAVAVTDDDVLYNVKFVSLDGPQIVQTGSSGSYSYSVAAEFANRPMNYPGMLHAMRFANWMHNGQPNGLQDPNTTEDGAYVIDTTFLGSANIVRNPGAKWALPTIDEWLKAGYHKNNGNTGDYYIYPTSSDARPGFVTNADVDGVGKVIAADPGNTATWDGDPNIGQTPPGIGPPWYRTEVGEHENSASPYGTFDQGGQTWEMTETCADSNGTPMDCADPNTQFERIRRGGNYEQQIANPYMQLTFTTNYAWHAATGGRLDGFRLVSFVPLCDFDDDMACGVADINEMMRQGDLVIGKAVGSGNKYDLDGNGTLNELDITEWLKLAGAHAGYGGGDPEDPGAPFLPGDTDDLDKTSPTARTVDITDFQNFLVGFTGAGSTWEVGNFNGDAAVDITDFSNHFLPNFITTGGGSYGPGQSSIPEPSSLLLLGLGGLLLGYLRRRDLERLSRCPTDV